MSDELIRVVEEVLWGGATPSGKTLKDILMLRKQEEIVSVLSDAATSFGETRSKIDNYLMKVVSDFLLSEAK
jgi:hypothetical protein